MTLPISSGSASRSVRALMAVAALLAALASGCRHPDKSFEREMGGTAAQAYRFSLGDGSFVSLRLWQPSLDVTATLVGPGGISVPVFDDPCHQEEPDRLVWSAKTAGEYHLIVKPQDPKSPRGRYRVEFLELRGSRSGDMERVAAEREYEEGRRSLCMTNEASKSTLARFQKALRLWKEQGEAADQVDALVQMINNFGSPELTPVTAMTLSRQALKLAKGAGYREGEAQALRAIGHVNDLDSQRNEAVGFLNQSIVISRSLHDDHQLGIALYSLGWDLYKLGQFDSAIKTLEESRDTLIRVRNLSQAAKASIAIANVFIDEGQTDKALEKAEEAQKLAQSINDPGLDATVSFFLA